jgi:hypothetical protein
MTATLLITIVIVPILMFVVAYLSQKISKSDDVTYVPDFIKLGTRIKIDNLEEFYVIAKTFRYVLVGRRTHLGYESSVIDFKKMVNLEVQQAGKKEFEHKKGLKLLKNLHAKKVIPDKVEKLNFILIED